MNNKKILITVSGPDSPGITSELMSIVSKDNLPIIDMGQSVTHGLLSLSFVLVLPSEHDKSDSVIKDLLFEANKMNQTLSYSVLPDNHIFKGLGHSYILNCVSMSDIPAAFLADAAAILAANNVNINRIDKVSPQSFRSLEISVDVPHNTDITALKSKLLNSSNRYSIDVAFLKDNVHRRSKRIIAFDMDSTLIQAEVIDEMAEVHGVGEKVKAITERAMNGELDFNQSIVERVGLLAGMEESRLKEIALTLPLTPGAKDFVRTVKNLGYKIAIISGGFTYFANYLKEILGLDYAFANELEVVNGKLTGRIKGTIVNAEQKALILQLIAQQENCQLEQVVAIGDGANDLPMLATAGLGIAFHAKEVVKKQAQQQFSHGHMTNILYFLGITDPNEGLK